MDDPNNLITENMFSNATSMRQKADSFSCERCGKTYTRSDSRARHVKFECGVEPQFECPVCHKKTRHKHNLLMHMKRHKSVDPLLNM